MPSIGEWDALNDRVWNGNRWLSRAEIENSRVNGVASALQQVAAQNGLQNAGISADDYWRNTAASAANPFAQQALGAQAVNPSGWRDGSWQQAAPADSEPEPNLVLLLLGSG